MSRRRIITLTTDFGLEDNYVGVLRGVILGLNRAAQLVDLCHSVAPQDVAAAALTLATSHPYFPDDTIHVVVVDPGVGTERAALALATSGGTFVGPDNGVFDAVIREHCPDLPSEAGPVPAKMLSSSLRLIRLTNDAYWRPRVSATFHGRDIFAPVAAHLSLGVPLARLGESADSVNLLATGTVIHHSDGTLVARIVQIDHFGNLITNLKAEHVAGLRPPLFFQLHGRRVPGLFRYYAEGPELMALIGSSDRIEIALRNGSAAAALGARAGDRVDVIPHQGMD